MKLPKPDLRMLPMTKGEIETFLCGKGLTRKKGKMGRLQFYIDLKRLIVDHNYEELKRYYEGMLPNVEVIYSSFCEVDDRLIVEFIMDNEKIERVELDRLIELRCFL